MKPLILAFQFLTIIPLRVAGNVSGREIARSAVFFPLVGAFQGLLAVSVGAAFLRVVTPEIAAGLILTALVISNGGFHLDGLADTFDGLAVKSGGDREADRVRRLAVMKDSSTGAIGVTAIVFTVLLKFLLVSSLLVRLPRPFAFSVLFLMPVLSKWGMVVAMCCARPARGDGLGRIFLDNMSAATIVLSSLFAILVSIPPVVLHPGNFRPAGAPVLLFVLPFAGFLFSFASARFCGGRFGGLTGDNFGAIAELSEVIFLMVVMIWFHVSIS
jgi:adenosylcobinamide-GDP ribazoletransferase